MNTFDQATRFFEAGLSPHPTTGTNTRGKSPKAPYGDEWKSIQTQRKELSYVRTILTDNPDRGLGVITGNTQTSGEFLEALDVEGRAVSAGLWDEYQRFVTDSGAGELLERVRAGYEETTPSGGVHVLWRCSEVQGNLRLANDPETRECLIETRGRGGFIVVAPTQGYELLRGGPETIATITPEERDLLLSFARELVPSAPTVTSAPREKNTATGKPGDVFNERMTWSEVVEPLGWTLVSEGADGVAQWLRPGDTESTHSATTNFNGTDRLVNFSTSVPELNSEPDEQDRRSSYSKFDVWTIFNFGGDYTSAARAAADMFDMNPASGISSFPVLPPEFWESRESLRHIRDAAHANFASADAVLHQTLARVAAGLPAGWRMDTGVGSPCAVNYFTAVVGPSGIGKSHSSEIAAKLVPSAGDLVTELDGIPLGSGEGFTSVFFKVSSVSADGGKASKRMVQSHHNALFFTDEGESVMKMLERSGATLGPTLRSAWSGKNLGQANASAETKRILLGDRYSVGVVIGFQPTTILQLLQDDAAGTPQRFTFAPVIDPYMDPERVDPGPLNLDFLKGSALRKSTLVDEVIRKQLSEEELAIRTGRANPRPLQDSQKPAMVARVAALLAYVDGRCDVSGDDWSLAEQVYAVSAAFRSELIFDAKERERAEADAKTEYYINREVGKAAAVKGIDAAERRVREWLLRKLDEKGPMTSGKLKGLGNSRDSALINASLDALVYEGTLNLDGTKYSIAE